MLRIILSAVLLLSSGLPANGQTTDNQSTNDRIHQTAVDQIVGDYSLTPGTISVRVDQVDAALRKNDELRLEFSNHWETPRGRVQADILSKTSGNRWTKNGWALLYVSHYDSVVVSRSTFRPDDKLGRDEIKHIRTNVTKLRNEPLTSEQFRSQCTNEPCFVRQYIREGDLIRRDAIRHRYAAKAGEMVEMLYRRHGISANLQCRARQSGYVGDVVRISCSSTGSIYRVELTDDGTAEWRETL